MLLKIGKPFESRRVFKLALENKTWNVLEIIREIEGLFFLLCVNINVSDRILFDLKEGLRNYVTVVI